MYKDHPTRAGLGTRPSEDVERHSKTSERMGGCRKVLCHITNRVCSWQLCTPLQRYHSVHNRVQLDTSDARSHVCLTAGLANPLRCEWCIAAADVVGMCREPNTYPTRTYSTVCVGWVVGKCAPLRSFDKQCVLHKCAFLASLLTMTTDDDNDDDVDTPAYTVLCNRT